MTAPSGAGVEVVEAGLAVAVQDRGRLGWRRLGVPVSGALDPALLALANALAGNGADSDAAGLEVPATGPTLEARSGWLRFALVGPIQGTVQSPDAAPRPVPAWSSAVLGPGERLKVGAVEATDALLAIGYVAVSGGFQVPQVLSSRSTYARAGLGHALVIGDRLACGSVPADDAAHERRGAAPFRHADGPIRVLPGPQDDHFTDAALETFFSATFGVTADSDRMGRRLSGPKLVHGALGADIASDGVTPGAIQVPADGQPIVLMADGQTVGGYPKIATVIRADLPRLAHLRPGATLRFARTTLAEAAVARAQLAAQIARWIDTIAPFQASGRVDLAALQACNLISGLVRGDDADTVPLK